MKALAFSTVAFLVLTGTLFSFSSVSGYVKEIDTEKPIKGATIYIQEDNEQKSDLDINLYITKTVEDGFFSITVIPGKYRFYVEIPKVGMIAYAFIGSLDFHDFEIRKGQRLKFIFLIGKSRVPVLEKKISEDGNTIYVKMLHFMQ